MVVVVLLGLALVLALQLNNQALLASGIGAVLMAVYPLAKRYVPIPQLVLGVVFSWGIVVAWLAMSRSLREPVVWLLFAANFFLGSRLRHHLRLGR